MPDWKYSIRISDSIRFRSGSKPRKPTWTRWTVKMYPSKSDDQRAVARGRVNDKQRNRPWVDNASRDVTEIAVQLRTAATVHTLDSGSGTGLDNVVARVSWRARAVVRGGEIVVISGIAAGIKRVKPPQPKNPRIPWAEAVTVLEVLKTATVPESYRPEYLAASFRGFSGPQKGFANIFVGGGWWFRRDRRVFSSHTIGDRSVVVILTKYLNIR